MNIAPDNLIPGRYYEVTYLENAFSDKSVYLCQAIKNDTVKTIWKNERKYQIIGGVNGAGSIYEITEYHALHNKRAPMSNEEALQFLITGGE